MSLQVLVRDPQGNFRSELDVIEKADTLGRFNLVGSWSLNCPESDALDQLSQRGWGVSIRRNGSTLMSGPWWQTEETRDPSKSLTVSGYSDAVYLWDKIAYPCAPTDTQGLVFGGADSDQRSGACESVMRAFVDFNNRPADGFLPIALQPDRARGGAVVETTRFGNLGDFLSSVAIHGGGLGFDVVDLEFVVYQPVDRRAAAVFSVASGNLQKFTYKTTAPTATHIIVAGKGQSTERAFVLKGNDELATTWGRRIEFFRDRRDTDDLVELGQTADEELQKQGEKTELALTPIDLPSRTYGEDYGRGDLVTAEGIEGIVSEVRITVDGNGEVITPSVSTTASTDVEAMLRRYDDAIRAQRRRLDGLERGL